jgi:hypothetical protein
MNKKPINTSSICAICHVTVDTTKTRIHCPKCGQPYHHDCWTYNNHRCAVLGCIAPIPTRSETVVSLAFHFRSGDTVYSPEELVPYCDKFWNEAKEYLYSPHQFRKWFVDLRRNDIVIKAEICATETNKDIGLEKFLQSLQPSLKKPFIEIDTQNTQLKNYNYETIDGPIPKMVIKNNGRGCCYGTIESNAHWLGIQEKSFAIPPDASQILEFHTNKNEFVWEISQTATVKLITNSANKPKPTFDFYVTTSKYPLLTKIESLRDEGKWRIALEQLERLDVRHANANKLMGSIEISKDIILKKILIGASIAYGLIGIFIGPEFFYGNEGFFIGAILGAIAGPLASFTYFHFWGGEYGSEIDYTIGGLALTIVLITLALIAALLVALYYIVIGIIILIIIAGLLSGGG